MRGIPVNWCGYLPAGDYMPRLEAGAVISLSSVFIIIHTPVYRTWILCNALTTLLVRIYAYVYIAWGLLRLARNPDAANSTLSLGPEPQRKFHPGPERLSRLRYPYPRLRLLDGGRLKYPS